MGGSKPRKAELGRWRREIIAHLEDFPRQYAALESAMSEFGEDFELAQFKQAYETATDMSAYNQVQAVERAAGRVQNYVAELSIAGVKLAGLERPLSAEGGNAQVAFETLREAGVISGELCRRLKRAQEARKMIEHDYTGLPAGRTHAATKLVHESAHQFIASFRGWIDDYL